MDGLMQALSEIGGIPRDTIGAKITEGPASWSMKKGQIMPEPGQEGAEWYVEHAAT